MAKKAAKRIINARWTLVRKGHDDYTVPGSLEISDEFPTHTIRLDEPLPGMSQASGLAALFSGSNKRETYPILYGETMEGLYTAIDSTVRSRSQGSSGIADIALVPSFVLHARLERDELFITEATVRFWDMDKWATFEDFSMERDPKTDDLIVRQHRIAPTTVEYKGATISVQEEAFQTQNGLGRITLIQRAQFKLEFAEPIPLRSLITDWLNPLGFWVSTGTRRTTGVESLYINNKEWKDPEFPDEPFRPVEMIPRNPKRYYEADDNPKMLHYFRHFNLQKQLPFVFETFFAHGFVIDQYLDFIHQPNTRTLTSFTTLASITEAFDRSLTPDPEPGADVLAAAAEVVALLKSSPTTKKYANDASKAVKQAHWKTMASRLSRLDNDSGGFVTKSIKTPEWKTDIPSVRNSIIHGLPSAAFFKKNVIPMEVGRDILRLLFEVRLLVALGFTKEEASKLMEENPYYYTNTKLITDYYSAFKDFADAAKSASAEKDTKVEPENPASEQ